jgi:hypothetical protein
MCNVFGMVAGERSSVAIECELAFNLVFQPLFAPASSFVHQFEVQRSFSESDNEISTPSR